MRKPPKLHSRGWRSFLGSGFRKLVGYGASTVLLALASMATIPAMIAADGSAVWGAIALGQTVGGVAAVATLYGWGWYGPARIARASPAERRSEYLESVVTRLMLAIPTSAIAAGVSYALSPVTPHFAAAGAVSATGIGLTAQWYFAGANRPLTFLTLETIPRVGGVVVGIALMHRGHSAIVGPISMGIGILVGFALSTMWIVLATRHTDQKPPPHRKVTDVLVSNRHGMIAAIGGAASNGAPVGIVSLLAPSIQPVFALVYKLFRQMITAFIPVIVILQGWVPRGPESNLVRRANTALAAGSVLSLAVGVITFVSAPYLLKWLGQGETSAPLTAMALMSGCVSLALFESIVSRSVLATFDRLQVCVRAVALGAAAGLPVVTIGAALHSVSGSVAGVLLTLLTMIVVELSDYFRQVVRAQ